ncbi:MIF4G domain-containing protein [Aspergillus tanneri]|uniref:Suppressor of glycerol defect n=1 Tax=Aspergillus tanneri TaxID=1220188 RepID=A0A5M9MRI5_9EURO|nr:suppressor of glycerol defect [Aspergillus tanneri]KAA8647179.1 suppressor of glycerol defect [Aspergillus tanneri]
MPRPRHNTTSLPRDLRGELGLKDRYREKKNRRNGPVPRKDRRRAERTEKKTKRAPVSKGSKRHAEYDDDDEDDFNELEGIDDAGVDLDFGLDEEMPPPSKGKSAKETDTISKRSHKKSKVTEDSEPESDDENNTRPPPSTISKSVQEKLDQDDAEIAALEKKLGLKKGKKLPKSFEDDGLDELLGDLDDGSADESRKRKREANEWLRSKRRKAQGLQSDSESAENSDMRSDEMDGMDEEEEDDFGGFDEDGEEAEDENDEPAPKKRENPYTAPVSAPEPSENRPQKYIPPSLRAASNSESETLTRLRRQSQGHLNKLSEANLVSILAEFEKLYREYPRQNVTSTLITLLLGLICERSALQDTFVILHAGFIAAVYKVVGMDFGAELVQKVVELFDAGEDERGKFEGKEAVNLMSLLVQLYNFHVIGNTLVFDYIRLFLQDITEDNTELLLKIIRNSGPQLRQDDPSALKDIVLLIQPAVAKAGEAALSVRTKFMIDTITDLKNNRMKSGVGVGSTTVTSEHITKMRKILGSLNSSRSIRASEPISISRNDIHNASKKGKWWLVGASWKEDPLESARHELAVSQGHSLPTPGYDSDDEPDYMSLAKAHRMNTDVRRSIFVAIMSAPDYQDAHVRLLKLRLKRSQEYEIPRVLCHCTMEEEAYNPYYTLIARRLCGEMGRRIKVSFMYTLWNIFKRMGETGADEDEAEFNDDDEQQNLPMASIVNLAKMYGNLIADGTLNLGILKTLNFAYLQPKTHTFTELLLITVIQQSQRRKKSKDTGKESEMKDEEKLMEIFIRTRDTPQMVKGLMYFLRKVVSKTDIVSEKEQRLF